MKKIILSALLCSCVLNAYADPKFNSMEFNGSNNKNDYLKNTINNFPALKNIISDKSCDNLVGYKKLQNTDQYSYYQAQCSNIKENLVVMLPNSVDNYSSVFLCSQVSLKTGGVICSSNVKIEKKAWSIFNTQGQ